jgi:hypothetical protein
MMPNHDLKMLPVEPEKEEPLQPKEVPLQPMELPEENPQQEVNRLSQDLASQHRQMKDNLRRLLPRGRLQHLHHLQRHQRR